VADLFNPMDRSFIQVPFLNLMANLQERADLIFIRLGGNTQETAALVDHLDDGKAFAKEGINNQATVRIYFNPSSSIEY
jgi:hypothetical protein